MIPGLRFIILVGIITPSIFITWTILELSLFIFLNLIKTFKAKSRTEETVYYFVVQALGRTLILFRWLLSLVSTLRQILIFLALLLKLGVFPFHRWYINLVNVVNSSIFWILRVPLKLIVLKLMFSLSSENWLIRLALLNILVSFVMVFKEKKLISFLGLASIFNTGWAILAVSSSWLWLVFIIIYGFNLKLILWILEQSLSSSFFYNVQTLGVVLEQYLVISGLIAMGLPPFSGFTIKVLIFFQVISKRWLIGALRLIRSVIISFYYLIIFFFSLSTSRGIEVTISVNTINQILRFVLLNLGISIILIIWVIYYLDNIEYKLKIKLR